MKLNHLSLSMIATACALALTACSSGGSSQPVENKLQPTAVKPAVVNQTDKLAEKEKALQAKEAELKEVSEKLAEERKALEGQKLDQAALAKQEKALNEKQAELEKLSQKLESDRKALENDKRQQATFAEEKSNALARGQKALDDKEKSLNQKEATLAEKQKMFDAMSEAEKAKFNAEKTAFAAEKSAFEAEKVAFEEAKAQFEAEKNKPDPIALNKIEVKKGFESNGTFSKTYTISSTNTLDETVETQYTQDFSHVSGKMLEVENNVLTHKAISPEQKDLNELMLEGKKVVLYSPEEIVAYKRTYPETNEVKELSIDGTVVGKVGSLPRANSRNGFAQMRYGYLEHNGKSTLFVQGNLTPESENGRSPYNHFFYGHNNPKGQAGEELKPTPTTGVFDYSGFAFMGKDNQYTEYKAQGVADFANKKIKVDLKNAEEVALTLGGKISGNTFEGTYQGTVTKGAFYGTEARDAGGIFYQTEGTFKDFHGVFGVTKASCGRTKCREVEDKTVLDNFSPEE